MSIQNAQMNGRPSDFFDRHSETLEEVIGYLRDRGLAADSADAADLLHKLLTLPARHPEGRVTVTRAAELLYMSRRTLGRHCKKAGLPHPNHILAFGRVLHTVHLTRLTDWPIRRTSLATGWPDPFSFSNAAHRLTGTRPSIARERGPLYLAEAWLQKELDEGRAELREPQPPECPSCGQEIQLMAEGA